MAEGFKVTGVVVTYSTDTEIQNSKRFLALGLQTAADVPLQCDESKGFSTFRIGLDKLGYVQKVAKAA